MKVMIVPSGHYNYNEVLRYRACVHMFGFAFLCVRVRVADLYTFSKSYTVESSGSSCET